MGYKAQIIMDPDAAPKFCKASTVPYAYKSLVNGEIDRLVQQGILKPVTGQLLLYRCLRVIKKCKDLWGL